jgi:16S rRNA G1207 methylase RsmC
MSEHYYSEKQTSELRIREIDVNLRGNILKFRTGSGVFSIGKIDKGTKLLIEKCIVKKDWKILELGCGYGCVGIAIGKAFPSTSVLMTDINERAVKLSRMNIKLNKVENVKVRKSDLYKNIHEKFDTIITNPPQTAGKKICFEIIEKAKEHLNKNGLLQLVARHNKGGKELEKKMKKVFGNVKDIGKKAGYRVYVAKLL